MQIAAQSSDEEEHYAPTGVTGDVQSGADTGGDADAMEVQVSLLNLIALHAEIAGWLLAA